ncbi:Protocadherin-20, partial [Paragonimus heterotremus]
FFIAKDGRIYLGHAKLDREQYSSYEILVQAEDHGVPRLTASTVVIIHILDVNDNTPYFIYPSSGNNTVYVPRTVRPKTVIAQVLAADVDAHENGRIRYSLKSDGREELAQLFELNEWSGELRLRVSLDQLNPIMSSPGDAVRKHSGGDYVNANQPHRENKTEPNRLKHEKEDLWSSHQSNSAYSLLITASDLGTPTLKSSTILRILFSPPFFPPQPTYTQGFQTPEDEKVKKISKLSDNTQNTKSATSWLTIRGDFEDDLTGLGVLFGLVIAIGLFVCLVLLLITVLLRRSRKMRSRQQRLHESRAQVHTESLPHSTYSATFEGNSSTNSRQIADQTCSRYEENSPLVHGTLRYVALPKTMEIH